MTDTTGWKLVLLRHAKSAWPDVPDHDRPLAGRGRRDAPTMGRWLRTADYVPDKVLCSTARRARETWQLVQPELRADPPVRFERRVYQASAAQLLDLAHRTPAAVRTLLIVGHDPAIQELALMLAKAAPPAGRDAGPGVASPAAFDRMRAKFPTAAIAVLELSGSWRQLAAGTARLARFVTPRELAGTGGTPAGGR
jgi:phosphohistidine phosphatase